MSGAVLVRAQTQEQFDAGRARRANRRALSPLAAYLWDDLRASVGIPASKIDYSQVTLIRKSARDQVQRMVQGTVGQSTIARDFQAFDASNAAAASARFARLSNRNALVAQTWDVNDNNAFALPNNKAYALFGYQALSASPLIDAIRFTLGGQAPLAIFNLAPAYTDMTSAILYFDPPVYFSPGYVFQYDLLAEVAISAAAESFALLGYVAEPAGINVLADPPGLT
jgi:hypothetical protein